jgi:hypothetical protein
MAVSVNDVEQRKAWVIGGIVRAAHHYADAEAELRESVAEARHESVSWAEVGMALGISPQAAQERFGKRRGRSGAEVRMMVAGVPKSPKGSDNIDQSVFKASLTIRLEAGESKREAVENAAAQVKATSPEFVPSLPPGFLNEPVESRA